jgi:RimJ/RimL family protein N-acetyltransferase
VSEIFDSGLLRTMTTADVPDVLDVQEPGAVLGLSDVFPQDAYPFPRDDVTQRWLQEIVAPGIDCYVIVVDGAVVGFAAIRGNEFLHFGTAVERWGTGIAQKAHDAVLDRMRSRGVQRAWLRVFTENGRGRRFYEKLGWRPTGERAQSSYPPHAELLLYERSLTRGDALGMCQNRSGSARPETN